MAAALRTTGITPSIQAQGTDSKSGDDAVGDALSGGTNEKKKKKYPCKGIHPS